MNDEMVDRRMSKWIDGRMNKLIFHSLISLFNIVQTLYSRL